jgi:glucose/arabinose dehydrogenase
MCIRDRVSTEVGEDVHDFKETYVGTDGRFYDVYTGPDGQFYLVSHDGKVVVPTGEYRS